MLTATRGSLIGPPITKMMTKTPKCRRFKWSTNLAEFRLPFYLYSCRIIFFYAIKNRFQIYHMRKENTRKGTTGEKISSYKYGFVSIANISYSMVYSVINIIIDANSRVAWEIFRVQHLCFTARWRRLLLFKQNACLPRIPVTNLTEPSRESQALKYLYNVLWKVSDS